MGKMAGSFNTTVPALEDELTQLILDDQIQARIDSHNKVMQAIYCLRKSTSQMLANHYVCWIALSISKMVFLQFQYKTS